MGKVEKAVRRCTECGSKRLRLEVPPDFEEFEVCRDCGHIQGRQVPRNVYRLQTRDGKSYAPSSRDRCNALVTTGRAEWAGTDYDEDKDAYVHFADRIDE